jgi:His/Glu/Gln/Arg/opine family amino acid ABC transporter permease subunit
VRMCGSRLVREQHEVGGKRIFLPRMSWTDALSLALGLGILALIYFAIDWKFVRTLDFRVVVEYWRPLVDGLALTLAITAAAMALGLIVGIILAILIQLPIGPFRLVFLAYIEIWRNTPLIVQLFWVHFGLPVLTGISTTAFQSGFLALAMQSSAYLADVARAGIQAVPRGQWDASAALGLPARSRWMEVILPQALKMMIPAFANLAVSFVNGSALLGLLSVGELMTTATRISDYTFKPIEIMTTVGALYLGANVILSHLAARLEHVTRRAV